MPKYCHGRATKPRRFTGFADKTKSILLAGTPRSEAQSKWKLSRSGVLTGLWSGLDGMISTFCFKHF